MYKQVFYSSKLLFLLILLVSIGRAQSERSGFISADQIKPGMKGVAWTVFQGVKPEPMELEVLGVMRNSNGPKGNIILIRLQGKKAEYTGVVAGMSGSPVYIEGKLAGALAFRIGEFSKEPIAGVTPIQEMLEINELDGTGPGTIQAGAASERREASRTSGPGLPPASPTASYSDYLKPIAAPLVFNGFSEETMQRFAPSFAAAGVVPVMGVGSVSGKPQPEAIEPGSAISAVLVRGDMDIAATCTVTYVDPQRLLACGHPILQFGQVQMPMYKAEVLATLPSPANAFKIVNVTEPVGAFVQDRHTGILGHFGQEARMIPVTLTIHGAAQPRQFHYEVINNARLTPTAMAATVFQALRGMNDYGEDVTYRLNGRITVSGFPAVNLENMFAPNDSANPSAYDVSLDVGSRFNRIYENSYARPDIKGVDLDVSLTRERRRAQLETARTDVTEARPGDEIMVETVLRPYRGDRLLRQIPVKIPTSTPRGTLRILVSDGETLDRMARTPVSKTRSLDLASTIAMLNQEHANTSLYVSLLQANPEARVEDKVMPALPISVMNVMDGMRGTQDMIVVGESSVNEASARMDYVVSGSQVITINVK